MLNNVPLEDKINSIDEKWVGYLSPNFKCFAYYLSPALQLPVTNPHLVHLTGHCI